MQRDRLLRSNVPKLRLFEVRRDPHIVDLRDGEKPLPGSHMRAHLGGAFHYDTGYRRLDFRIAELELRLLHLHLRGLGAGLFGRNSRAPERNLLRRTVTRLRQFRFRLRQLGAPLIDDVRSGSQIGPATRDHRLLCVGRRRYLVVFLL